MSGADWKIAAVTFGTVFLAELGDKTQLAALGLSATSGRPWIVFVAGSLALIAATAMAAALGGLIATTGATPWIRRAGAALFIVIGVVLLLCPEAK